MQKRHLKPNLHAYNVMLRCLGKNLKSSRVSELLAEMKARGLEPDEYTYASLIEFYGRAQQMDVAIETFEEFWRKTFSSKDSSSQQYTEARPTSAVISIILDQCGYNKRCNAGAKIWSRLLHTGWRPSTNNFNSYIEMWARNGFYKEAEDAIAQMAEIGVKHNPQTWTIISSFKNRQAADLSSASDQKKSSEADPK